MNEERLTARTITEARYKAMDLLPAPVRYNAEKSGGGNNGFWETEDGTCWFSDLGCRVEVVTPEWTKNIWVEPERFTIAEIAIMVQRAMKRRKLATQILSTLDEDGEWLLHAAVVELKDMVEQDNEFLKRFGL